MLRGKLFELSASMRALAATAVLLLAGCGGAGEPPPAPSTSVAARHVDAGNVRRVRRDLPPGYESAAVADVTAPPGVWGLGGGAAAVPERCGVLADPAAGHGQRAQGISGSGAGGTLYAIVVGVPTGPLTPDRSLLSECRQWTMAGRRATARVRLTAAPHVDDAETIGIAAEIVTSVEGGNEIASQASTFIAYLGDCYAFTTLLSDPGSPNAALTPQFAADLLVKTVSAVRG